MKKFFEPLFVVYCALWCLIHFFRWVQHPLPWLNNYLTDFVFVPVIAHMSVSFIRWLLKDSTCSFPVSYLLCMALYAAIVFEYAMPRFSPVYTGDWGDVLAYFLGALFYYYVHQGKIYRSRIRV